MGAPNGYTGGGGYSGQYGSPTGSGYGAQPYGAGMGQQPAYGMGTGGQYSPQLRQAQTAWQNQYTPAAETQVQPEFADSHGYGPQYQQAQAQMAAMRAQAGDMGRPYGAFPTQQPYGMGAQGMGNAYGYGGQQGNPWAQPQRLDMSNVQTFGMPQQQPAPPAAPPMSQAQPPMQAPAPPPPAMSQATFNVNNLPRGSYQIGGYNGGAAAPAPRPPAAAPTRANYSASNPYGGMYANPQADAWEQQQRSGGLPAPVAPQTDMMRKALSGVDNGYGYGTPGGYQLDTAPSTLDPGSMNGLLGFLGGNINGVGYPTSAANYANWYQQTYGQQAPGGPRAYPF